jgi:hypothetical protein
VERGYNQVIIQSDFQLAMNLCNGGHHNRLEITTICQEKLWLFFRRLGRLVEFFLALALFLLGVKKHSC